MRWEESRPAARVSLRQEASLMEKKSLARATGNGTPSHSARSAEQEIAANPTQREGSGGAEDGEAKARS